MEQCRREEERNHGMAHTKTQIDLISKHLLSSNMEKLKTVGSHSRIDECYSEEEENYLKIGGRGVPIQLLRKPRLELSMGELL